LGYRGDRIRRYFLEYGVMNADIAVAIDNGKVRHLRNGRDELHGEVILADTGALTGTGGRIKKAEGYVEGDTFLATYGDGLSDVDIRKLVEFHLQHGKIATMTGVRPMTRFGQLIVTDELAVGFQEKPQLDRGWVNGGFFVFSRKIFDYLDEECTLEREPLERLAAEGQLAVYQHEGYWRCMDTYREMKALEEEWQSGKPGWKTW
jgi:glucose-1-phosphate cytidylyltransferase